MKKFLLLAVAAVTLTASANALQAGTHEMKLGNKHSMEYKATVQSNLSLDAEATIAGTYVGKAVTEDPVNTSGAVTIEVGTTANSYTITGAHLGVPNGTVQGTLAGNKLTIPAGQVVYNSSSYGPAALYAMDEDNLYDLVFTLQEDGSLVLDNNLQVAMILTTGTYKDYTLGDTFSGYEFLKPNGTITFDALEADLTPANPAVEQYNSHVALTLDADNNVTGGVVCGFDDMTWLPFTVGDNNAVQFSTDKVYYYSSDYQLAFASDIDANNMFSTNAGPTGTIDAQNGTITMPMWTIILPTKGTNPTYYILNSVKQNCVITFPAIINTAINDVNVEKASKARKYVIDGQLVIEKDGVKYNVTGQVIK